MFNYNHIPIDTVPNVNEVLSDQQSMSMTDMPSQLCVEQPPKSITHSIVGYPPQEISKTSYFERC